MAKDKQKSKINFKQILAFVLSALAILIFVFVMISNSKSKKYISCVQYEDKINIVDTTGTQTQQTIDHILDYEYFRIHFDNKTEFTLEYKLTGNNKVYKFNGTYTKTKDELVLTYNNFVDEIYGECKFKKVDNQWVREQFVASDDNSMRFTRIQKFNLGK